MSEDIRLKEAVEQYYLYLAQTKPTTHWRDPPAEVGGSVTLHPTLGWQFKRAPHWP